MFVGMAVCVCCSIELLADNLCEFLTTSENEEGLSFWIIIS